MHRSRCIRTCIYFTVTLGFAATSWAGTHYVDAASKSGADDGTSWVNSFRGSGGLRKALLAAAPGDEIWVARGTYFPTRTSDRTKRFEVPDGVSLYGGFAGGESALWQRNLSAHETILSGDLAEDDSLGNLSDNSLHVVTVGRAVLDGFTVTGGNADATSGDGSLGAGIYGIGYQGVVRNCVIRGNRCRREGGGLYLAAGTVEDCRLEDNVAGVVGGAVYVVDASDLEIRRCSFTRNTAPRGSAVSVRVVDSGYLRECLFHGNVATDGGTIYVADPYASTLSIESCTLAANVGGGLRSEVNPTVRLFNSIFATGGSSYPSAAQVTFDHCCTEVPVPGAGNLSGDPKFSDAAGGNFRLAPTSPCIDAGGGASGNYDLDRSARREDDPSVPDAGGPAPAVDMGAFETPGGLFTLACAGDTWLPRSCPCANFGTEAGGCANSSPSSWGAYLEASGTASPDTVRMRASGLANFATCILLQGSAISASGFVFGDGIRCVAGSLKRIASQTSNGGIATFPAQGDPQIRARSAALGDPIAPGTRRHYQVWYRDPDPTFCPAPTGGMANVSSAITVYW